MQKKVVKPNWDMEQSRSAVLQFISPQNSLGSCEIRVESWYFPGSLTTKQIISCPFLWPRIRFCFFLKCVKDGCSLYQAVTARDLKFTKCSLQFLWPSVQGPFSKNPVLLRGSHRNISDLKPTQPLFQVRLALCFTHHLSKLTTANPLYPFDHWWPPVSLCLPWGWVAHPAVLPEKHLLLDLKKSILF